MIGISELLLLKPASVSLNGHNAQTLRRIIWTSTHDLLSGLVEEKQITGYVALGREQAELFLELLFSTALAMVMRLGLRFAP